MREAMAEPRVVATGRVLTVKNPALTRKCCGPRRVRVIMLTKIIMLTKAMADLQVVATGRMQAIEGPALKRKCCRDRYFKCPAG